MGTGRRVLEKFAISGELLYFFWQQKLWWLIPMIVVLLFFGIVMIVAQGSAIAPLIYTLF